jgi:hypothetical protein
LIDEIVRGGGAADVGGGVTGGGGTFEAVRNRSKVTKGPGLRAAGIAMAFELIEAALVRAGAKFDNGKPAGRPDTTAA